MNSRIPCEFFLIRYIPDVVKGEFTNIGVVLREVPTPEHRRGAATQVRFTRDWRRVRCIDPAADTDLLESLEGEIAALLLSEASGPAPPRPLLHLLSDTLSNSIQITEPRATLAESFALELEQLLRLYIEPIRMKVTREKTGRAAISAAMRREFERAGVWPLMRKRIAAAAYTRKGDPMKLDCGYRPEGKTALTLGGGVIRIFHAVSLENDAEAAKGLAYSAPQLREGLMRVENAALDLAAVVEPLRSLSGRKDPDGDAAEDFTDEAADLYRFGVAAMESASIRVLTVHDLARAAETARAELHP